MVEQNAYLDRLFSSLADPIRRDIVRRLASAAYSIRQIASDYDISFSAVAKHVSVLERANVVTKERQGKEQIVQLAPQALADAQQCIATYEALWNRRFDLLEALINEGDCDE